jgi:periplasmic protein TonB
MIRIMFVFYTIFFCQISFAQNVIEPDDNNIYSSAGIEKVPEFPGGIEGLTNHIKQNFILPNVKGLHGRVFVEFVVEKDGTVSDVKAIRDIGYRTGEEAVRVVKLFPLWIPGQHNGKLIRIRYSLPIMINTI